MFATNLFRLTIVVEVLLFRCLEVITAAISMNLHRNSQRCTTICYSAFDSIPITFNICHRLLSRPHAFILTVRRSLSQAYLACNHRVRCACRCCRIFGADALCLAQQAASLHPLIIFPIKPILSATNLCS